MITVRQNCSLHSFIILLSNVKLNSPASSAMDAANNAIGSVIAPASMQKAAAISAYLVKPVGFFICLK